MELILLLIVIINVIRIIKKNANSNSTPDRKSAPSSDTCGQIPPPKSNTPSAQAVQKTVNQHLFGSSSKPTDKYQLYKRFIEQDRYTDLAKLGHELGISKYQAAQDIKNLQKAGYFKTVTLDDRNYKLSYTTSARYAARPVSSQPPSKPTAASKPSASKPAAAAASASDKEDLELTYVKPSEPYRPDHNTGIRHESWMQLPPHTQAVTCHYCGAGNAVPIGRRTKYTCYFCREEL